MNDLMFCEQCSNNFEDEAFDYRFDYPVCFECVRIHKLEPKEEI